MNKKLYIGNLSQSITEEDLKANFSSIGEVVSVSIIKDKFTGTSRGFGFVEMMTAEAAAEAIQKFNGGALDGMTIVVNEAREKTAADRERRPGGSYSQNRGPGGGRPGGGFGGGRPGGGSGGGRPGGNRPGGGFGGGRPGSGRSGGGRPGGSGRDR
jgi:RNA recognition motif-containing protein